MKLFLIVAIVLLVGWDAVWWVLGVKPRFPWQLKARLGAGASDPVLLDVRTPWDYSWFHLPGAQNVPELLADSGKIAVRLPGHPVTLRLIQELGRPIVGTSANLHGSPAALTAAEVKKQLGDAVDFIIDGGPCEVGIESTIVDVSGDQPAILRPGRITAAQIEKALNIQLIKASDESPAAPGSFTSGVRHR